MLSTILFSVATPDCELIQAQQCRTILLTTLNNAGSTLLFNAVFHSPGQVVRFLLCKFIRQTMKIVICFSVCLGNCPATHVKISQLVASLQTSRQQVVLARLVTSCQQVWNKLLTTCNNLVDIIRLVTRLFPQGCYNHDITILLEPCVVNLVTFLLYHDCIRLVRTTL